MNIKVKDYVYFIEEQPMSGIKKLVKLQVTKIDNNYFDAIDNNNKVYHFHLYYNNIILNIDDALREMHKKPVKIKINNLNPSQKDSSKTSLPSKQPTLTTNTSNPTVELFDEVTLMLENETITTKIVPPNEKVIYVDTGYWGKNRYQPRAVRLAPPSDGYSIDSPLGKCIIGKHKNESFSYSVEDILYQGIILDIKKSNIKITYTPHKLPNGRTRKKLR